MHLPVREQAPGPLSKAVRTGLELPSGWTACPSLGVELEQLRVIPIKVLCLRRPAVPRCAVQPQWPAKRACDSRCLWGAASTACCLRRSGSRRSWSWSIWKSGGFRCRNAVQHGRRTYSTIRSSSRASRCSLRCSLVVNWLRVQRKFLYAAQVGLVLDLTNTWRYYDPSDWLSRGVEHHKVLCPCSCTRAAKHI